LGKKRPSGFGCRNAAVVTPITPVKRFAATAIRGYRALWVDWRKRKSGNTIFLDMQSIATAIHGLRPVREIPGKPGGGNT